MTPAELKDVLSLEFVCAQLGITLDIEGHARCPFHQDQSPSFYLWDGDDGLRRWWCQPCGFGGDVFDLIQRFEGIGFTDAYARATEMLGVQPDDWRPLELDTSPASSAPNLATEVDAARARAQDPGALGYLCVVTGLQPDTAPANTRCALDLILRDQLGWGLDEDSRVLMPHWDLRLALTGVKVRSLDGAKWNLRGSKFPALYGAWLGKRATRCMLTEGETDMAYVMAQRVPDLDVRALPSGVANTQHDEDWFDELQAYETVYLALDADDVSLPVTRKWLYKLPNARVCRLPYGHDLRSARPQVAALLEESLGALPLPADFGIQEEGYWRMRGEEPRRVTSWLVYPTAHLIADDDERITPALDVQLHRGGRMSQDVITMDDLHNESSLRRWAGARSLSSQATSGDVNAIATWLMAFTPALPLIHQTQRVGLHNAPSHYGALGRAVVFPEGSIGRVTWRYVGTTMHDQVHLRGGDASFSWLSDFLDMNDRTVTEPFLAWLIAATRRIDVLHFPMMMLAGSSGSGKTTLARTGCKLIGSSIGTQLGSATPFTLMRMFASSTTLPVLVDEWTRQSRQSSRDAFQDAVPALYEGGVVQRGRQDLSVIEYKMKSPVLIAGEDSFHLDREMERMVTIRTRREGINPDALRSLAHEPIENFAFWYYSWLVQQDAYELPHFPAITHDRPSYNRACLVTGWNTLRMYLDDTGDATAPNLATLPDLSALDLEDITTSRTNEYEAALVEGAAMRDHAHNLVVWQADEGVYVRWRALIPLLEQRRDIELPGRSRAMQAYFAERWTLTSHNMRMPTSGDYAQVWLIGGLRLEDLGPDETS